MTNILDQIDRDIKGNDIVLYMKGTPDFPQCGFSSIVCQILNHLGLTFHAVNVLENDEIRQAIKEYTNWPTIPQLYIKGEFIGGSDIVKEMFQNGELKTLLTEKGIAIKAA